MARILRVFSLLLVVTVAAAPAVAQRQSSSPQDTAGSPVRGAPALTRPDLEAWLDGFLPYALARGDVAGAVVVVVKDGEVLLQKGYGYADVATRTPVDPERTLFRPGSVGKLFTWTAVMQLVEQGKLDLDRDVNAYLDFRIPPRAGLPITLRNLMTHTPGFEEIVKGLLTIDPARLPRLGQYVRSRTPRRAYPPGTVPAYSNYGVALAGYIVERVSGEPFDDYIERHIFAPLMMTTSTFRQPLPERFRVGMSSGYRVGSGPAQAYELFGPAPAGALTSTGADIARFMIAHLQNGAYDAARILRPETARQMHGTAFPVIPPLHSMLLGFMRRDRNGRRIVAHEGDTQFFHSALSLFIDDGVGMYVSMNSSGKDGAAEPIRTALSEQFADRYFPVARNDTSVDARTAKGASIDARTAVEHARAMTGRYEVSRSARSSFLSLYFFLAQIDVEAGADGTIHITAIPGLNGVPKRWREVAPYVWQEVGGRERLAARIENGRVAMFSIDGVSPFNVFLPVPWWKSSAWLLPVMIGGLSALLLTLVAWPFAAVVRGHYGIAFPLTGSARRAHVLIRVAALATLIMLIAWAGTVMPVATDLSLYSSRLDPWIRVLHIGSGIVFVGAVAAALWNVRTTWAARRPWYATAWNAALAVACLTVLWIAVAFRLIALGADF
jgi:CubicO group peptidase (beta-lactamase class C family)